MNDVKDDGSKQVEKVAAIGGGGILRKHWSMLVGSHPTFSTEIPSILSSLVSPIIQH